jgi:hypothetical protein
MYLKNELWREDIGIRMLYNLEICTGRAVLMCVVCCGYLARSSAGVLYQAVVCMAVV